MRKGIKRRIIASVLGIAVAAGSVSAVVMNYRNGEFRPDAYANGRERNDNQIVFPGQDMSSLGQETSDESELWEQDKNSDEKLRPEDKPSGSMLFETMKAASADVVQGAQNGDMSSDDAQPDSGDLVYVPETKSDQDGSNSKGDAASTPMIVVPGASGDSTITGDGHGGALIDTSTGNTTGQTDSTGHTTGNNTGSQDTQKPDGSHTGGSEEKPSGGDTPSKPQKPVDPDPTVPELPDENEDYKDLFGTEDYPDTGIPDITQDNYEKYSLKTVPAILPMESENSLYMGEYLNPWRVLCASYVYVCVDGSPKYRLTDYNDNFKIVSYPEQITETEITVTYAFRPSAEYDWIYASGPLYIEYQAKLLLHGCAADGGDAVSMVFMQSSEFPLFAYAKKYMDQWEGASADTQYVFQGFSESEGGSPLPPVYTVGKNGLIELYPLPPKEVSKDEYTLTWDSQLVEYADLNSEYATVLTLTNTKPDSSLVIPDGVQAVDLRNAGKKFDTVTVPASVVLLNNWLWTAENPVSFRVKNYYTVAEENSIYASYQGVLLNKAMTEILDIPYEMTSVTVPESVSKIRLPEENAIEELHFQSNYPKKYDFSSLSGVRIYVPKDAYMRYLTSWGKHPGGETNLLLAEDGEVEEFVEDDSCIYTADHKTLVAVKSTVKGTLVVPEGVETVAKAAFESCDALERVILPTTLKKLEDTSFSVNEPSKVVFLGEEAPEISAGTFADTSCLQVQSAAKASYETAWKEILGDDFAGIHFMEYQFVNGGTDDFTYLVEGDCSLEDGDIVGAILLKAPEDITCFDAASKEGVTWKEIAAYAFAGCEKLFMVELPESVKVVGQGAFSDCTAMQGVISYAKDTVTICEEAFFNDDVLRFVALNAEKIDAYNYWGYTMWYAPADGTGTGTVNRFSPDYYIKKLESGGYVLYGTSTEDASKRYLLRATDMTGIFTVPADVSEIGAYAFYQCAGSFEIDGLGQVLSVGDNAFAYSGISGTLTLGTSLQYIGTSAFQGCSGITEVKLDGSGLDESDGYLKCGYYMFRDCTNLEKVQITGTGYYGLRDDMFLNCIRLTTVSISETANIYVIGNYAFSNTAITSITIPASVAEIGYSVFAACSKLGKIIFSGTTPPLLTGYCHSVYFFTDDDSREGLLQVPAGSEQTYIDEWQYSILGYEKTEDELLSPAKKAEARNKIRTLLGIKELEEVPEEEETQNEDESWPDAYTMDAEEQGESSEVLEVPDSGEKDAKKAEASGSETLATDTDAAEQ